MMLFFVKKNFYFWAAVDNTDRNDNCDDSNSYHNNSGDNNSDRNNNNDSSGDDGDNYDVRNNQESISNDLKGALKKFEEC